MKTRQSTPISLLGTIIWLLAAGFFLYEFFLRALVGTIATQVIADLHLSAGLFAIIGSAYYLAYGIMQVPVGILVDKFGIRHSLIVAAILCTLSVFGLSFSTTFTQAFICRIVMGLGSSFGFICLLTIVAIWFPRKNFAFFSGLSQFIGTMGPLLSAGPLACLLAILNGNWRLLLTNIGLAGTVLTLLIFLFVKNTTARKKQQFIILRHQEPFKIRLRRLLKNPQIMAVSLYSAFIYSPMALLGAVWGTIYLQAHGYSQTSSANTISVAWLGYALGCLTLGLMSDFFKKRKSLLTACAAMGVLATSGIVFVHANSLYIYTALFACLGVAAAGQSLACATISEHADNATRATAFGLNNSAVILFNVFIPPLVGFIIGLTANHHGIHFQSQDFYYGFSIMPILHLAALVVAIFFIEETYCRSKAEVIIPHLDTASAHP
ncbi:MAG: hypothetical protein A3E85_04590 [Gammaproteobacteria bacterium RIFCSPHIGHO2_12_FULL_45_12]|nr:MAG: hypothetical protein A3E85_04590 [Gammaproteobacteria bacterium RIFCSPHIGHO2_12_FULL_45_12]